MFLLFVFLLCKSVLRARAYDVKIGVDVGERASRALATSPALTVIRAFRRAKIYRFIFCFTMLTVFQDASQVGDKGVLVVPLEFGEEGLGDGAPRIDWAAIEAANAGVQVPDPADGEHDQRILFSRVSHKTCRFQFILERTDVTLGDYLMRCLESDSVRVDGDGATRMVLLISMNACVSAVISSGARRYDEE